MQDSMVTVLTNSEKRTTFGKPVSVAPQVVATEAVILAPSFLKICHSAL
jgi:hypothetical protein